MTFSFYAFRHLCEVRYVNLFLDEFLSIHDVNSLCRIDYLTSCQVVDGTVFICLGNVGDIVVDGIVNKLDVVNVIPALLYEANACADGFLRCEFLT